MEFMCSRAEIRMKMNPGIKIYKLAYKNIANTPLKLALHPLYLFSGIDFKAVVGAVFAAAPHRQFWADGVISGRCRPGGKEIRTESLLD